MILKNLKTVLCEYTEYSGNLQQISIHLLKHIDINQNFICIPYDSFYFFYVKTKNPKVSILCISNYDNFKHELIYDFLDHISDKFLANLSEEKLDQALAYSFKRFVQVLKNAVQTFDGKNKTKKKMTFSRCGSGFTYYSGNILCF